MCSMDNEDSHEAKYKQKQKQNGTVVYESVPVTQSLQTDSKTKDADGGSCGRRPCCCCCGCDTTPCSTRKGRIYSLLMGLTLGCLLGLAYLVYVMCTGVLSPSLAGGTNRGEDDRRYNRTFWPNDGSDPNLKPARITIRKPLYIGVMTMPHHLKTRAQSCYKTWAQDPLISKLEFFTRSAPEVTSTHNLPLVQLSGNLQGDIYHTRTSFRMLQSICKRHVAGFDWFVRAVDDMYIHVDRLLSLLARVDKTKKIYMGHPSFAWDSKEASALQGAMYCRGGPGIVMSRPTLNAVCPYVSECERKFGHLHHDVAVGACVARYAGVHCTQTPEFQEHFYDSMQHNRVVVAEELAALTRAVTLHPLKAGWQMELLHHRSTSHLLQDKRQKLHDLRVEISYLESSLNMKNNSRTQRHLRTERNDRSVHVAITKENKQVYTNPSCATSKPAYVNHQTELNQALLLTKSSLRLGDLLSCEGGKSYGHYQRDSKTIDYTVGLLCKDLKNNGEIKLTRTRLTRPLKLPLVRKMRKNKTPKKVVALVYTKLSQDFMRFAMQIKQVIIGAKRQKDIAVYMIINDDRQKGAHALHNKYLMWDLKKWAKKNGVKFHAHFITSTQTGRDVLAESAARVRKLYPNSAVAFLRPDARFDWTYLQVCRALVRKAKQIYVPLPRKYFQLNSSDSNVVGSNDNLRWLQNYPPFCSHVDDFWRLFYGGKKNKNVKRKHKRLKAIRVTDPYIFIEEF